MIPLLSIGKSIWEQKEWKQNKSYLEVCEKKVIFLFICKTLLALFRICLFVSAHGWRGEQKCLPSPKMYHTYHTTMKVSAVIPYLKKSKKKKKILWHTSWVLLTSAFFHRKSATFVTSRNAGTDCILKHNFFF